MGLAIQVVSRRRAHLLDGQGAQRQADVSRGGAVEVIAAHPVGFIQEEATCLISGEDPGAQRGGRELACIGGHGAEVLYAELSAFQGAISLRSAVRGHGIHLAHQKARNVALGCIRDVHLCGLPLLHLHGSHLRIPREAMVPH